MSSSARRSSASPVSTCCPPTISTTPRRRSSRPSREPDPMADRLSAPTPTEEHRRLAVLAGEWRGEETVFASRWAEGGKATSEVSARIDLDGFYLIQDTRQTRDGKASFATHAVFTY